MTMDLPWIVGTLAAIAYFAYFEYRALRHPDRENTLSHWIYTLGSTWPLSIFLMGGFCFGLAVHFFWHWCPAGSFSAG